MKYFRKLLNLPSSSEKKLIEAIKKAKECATSTSILGNAGCRSISVKLNKNGKV